MSSRRRKRSSSAPTAPIWSLAVLMALVVLYAVGCSVCCWLVVHGLRNLIIKSRRDNSSPPLGAELIYTGYRVEILSYGITIESCVVITVRTCTEVLEMPPIMGAWPKRRWLLQNSILGRLLGRWVVPGTGRGSTTLRGVTSRGHWT
ncbi:hypothetical protein F5B21DRAFT_44852 [Xylaria acuta]|nr:hypothetical protein F5B21DRAFT_44852 [Xylaria acuta]